MMSTTRIVDIFLIGSLSCVLQKIRICCLILLTKRLTKNSQLRKPFRKYLSESLLLQQRHFIVDSLYAWVGWFAEDDSFDRVL